MTDAAAREQLIADLRADGRDIVRRVGALDPAMLEEGRHENGWNGRQILAHLAAIEWTYPRLIEIAATAPEESRGEQRAERPPREGMDGYNARQVAKRGHDSVAALLEEFRRNRYATIAAIEAASGALLQKPVRSAGGRTGTLVQVLREVAVEHVRMHAAELLGDSLDQSGGR
jgi:hypothetical protein